MGDDLDTLLDEVERKFCGKVSLSAEDVHGAGAGQKHEKHGDEQRNRRGLAVCLSIKHHSAHSWIISSALRLYVITEMSLLTPDAPPLLRSCDQLRCTSCDFGVLVFDDCEWDRSCDYLFFRNNVPERLKLQPKLRRRHGARSYCCQCHWTSVSELKELTPPLTWVCAGKHQD
uniref:Cilia- and flagella-associated protein 418 n=1 Tax=Periophthalmus magnuspinnatus TaxID=409849 RepID=A0A3B4AS50_9GOBI